MSIVAPSLRPGLGSQVTQLSTHYFSSFPQDIHFLHPDEDEPAKHCRTTGWYFCCTLKNVQNILVFIINIYLIKTCPPSKFDQLSDGRRVIPSAAQPGDLPSSAHQFTSSTGELAPVFMTTKQRVIHGPGGKLCDSSDPIGGKNKTRLHLAVTNRPVLLEPNA